MTSYPGTAKTISYTNTIHPLPFMMSRVTSFVHSLRALCSCRKPSRTHISNALSVSAQALEVLRGVGDGVCPPLKSACSIALSIIQQVQTFIQLREDHEELASRVAEIVLALCADSANDRQNFDMDQDAKLAELLAVLTDIQNSQAKQAKIKGLQKILRMNELKQNLSTYNRRLDDCCRLFNLCSLAEIRHLLLSDNRITLTSLLDMVTGINENIQRVGTSVEVSQTEVRREMADLVTRIERVLLDSNVRSGEGTVSSEEFSVVRQDQVNLHRILCTSHTGHIHRGDFVGSQPLTKAIVKSYNPGHDGQKDFLRDFEFWKNQFHANLHRLLGRSPLSAQKPFLLLSDYAYRDASEYMQAELRRGQVDSFMSTLQFLQGIASGLDYLLHHCSMNKTELEDCMRTSNLVITSEGKVIVGHNLVINGPGRSSQELEANLDTWLLDLFWWIGIPFLYGPDKPDVTNWNWVSCHDTPSSSHLRILQSFLNYLMGSLTASAKGLQTTMELLESHYHHGSLTFKDIRQVILQVRHWQVGNIYRPLKPVEIQLLDVGFMSNEKFTALENCSNMFQYETIFSPPSSSPRCTGTAEILMGESGHIMYVMQL